jgi:hypothetical protein
VRLFAAVVSTNSSVAASKVAEPSVCKGCPGGKSSFRIFAEADKDCLPGHAR